MNAVVEKSDQQFAPASPPRVFSIIPNNLGEALQLAEMMAESELVPKNYRRRPQDVIVAMQMGGELGLSPMAAIQNIGVINGKPGLYGDVGKALLLANGCIIEEDDIEVIKASGRARCKITRRGRPPVERTFSVENAKTAALWNKEGPWRNYPERQMAWRAFWFAARDAAADLLKGMGGAEELADITEIGSGTADPITGEVRDTTPATPAMYPEADFEKNLPAWRLAVESGKRTATQIISMVSSKGTLTAAQRAAILALDEPPAQDPANEQFLREMGNEVSGDEQGGGHENS